MQIGYVYTYVYNFIFPSYQIGDLIGYLTEGEGKAGAG